MREIRAVATATRAEPVRLHDGSRNSGNDSVVPADDPADRQGGKDALPSASAHAEA
jgi:hypothetical protein